MVKQPNDGLQYLQEYPQLRKWINQCVVCQRQGYKSDMPKQIGHGVAAKNLRRFFPKMAVDAAGHCDQCAVALRSHATDSYKREAGFPL